MSSANRFAIPAKINYQLCALPHTYAYLQIAPDVSSYQYKDDNTYAASHCIVTLTCSATNGTLIKVILSTLISQPKVSANSVYIPFRLKRWTTIAISLRNLFEKVFNNTFHFQSFVQFECTATSAVKGVYFSNQKFTPYDAPMAMYLPPPPKEPSNPPNIINWYDWCEVGFEQVQCEMKPAYLLAANKNMFSHNISYAVMIEKAVCDFQSEREKFDI